MRTTTLAELMKFADQEEERDGQQALRTSTPSKIFCMMAASETSASSAPTKAPAISENGTGTPR